MPNSPSTAAMLALSYAAYQSGTVQLVDRDLAGFSHLVASRSGLYAVNEGDWKLVAQGFFFGITLRGDDVFVFEACDLPRGPTRQGRLLRLTIRHSTIVGSEVLVKGLDNGCHQIDFIDGRLVVLDTYNQQVLRLGEDMRDYETLFPLPTCPTGRWESGDLDYVHVNSLLAVGEKRLLLLHNQSVYTGRKSELAVCDSNWNVERKITLDGNCCHGLALIENGTVLTTGSLEGRVVGTDGFAAHISPFMTRGLAVGADSVVVGASQLSRRDNRMHATGSITFMDRNFEVGGVLMLPGAPTEVRRLDGQDAGLSSYLARQSWGSTLLVETEASGRPGEDASPLPACGWNPDGCDNSD